MAGEFTLGDVIRKARMARRWNQTRLGAEAAKYPLRRADVAINKSTVSKVEKDPYTSEFGTVWRLLTALHLRFSDVEKRVGQPFIDVSRQRAVSDDDLHAFRQPAVSPSHTSAPTVSGSPNQQNGRALASSSGSRLGQTDAVSRPAPRLSAEFERATQAQERREARAARQSAPASRPHAAGGRARPAKNRR